MPIYDDHRSPSFKIPDGNTSTSIHPDLVIIAEQIKLGRLLGQAHPHRAVRHFDLRRLAVLGTNSEPPYTDPAARPNLNILYPSDRRENRHTHRMTHNPSSIRTLIHHSRPRQFRLLRTAPVFNNTPRHLYSHPAKMTDPTPKDDLKITLHWHVRPHQAQCSPSPPPVD